MKPCNAAVSLVSAILLSAWVAIPVTSSVSSMVTPVHRTVGFVSEAVSDVKEDVPLVESEAEPEEETEEEDQDPIVEEEYHEEYYEPVYNEPGPDSSDGFKQQGVRDGVDSDTETWYSSNNAYHYRTGEWTPDDEGYYRDADGYYVVSSDDYAEGEVIETSKGEAKVYDSGSGSGNTDMYVNW